MKLYSVTFSVLGAIAIITAIMVISCGGDKIVSVHSASEQYFYHDAYQGSIPLFDPHDLDDLGFAIVNRSDIWQGSGFWTFEIVDVDYDYETAARILRARSDVRMVNPVIMFCYDDPIYAPEFGPPCDRLALVDIFATGHDLGSVNLSTIDSVANALGLSVVWQTYSPDSMTVYRTYSFGGETDLNILEIGNEYYEAIPSKYAFPEFKGYPPPPD
jgi:hypothetical protein